MNKVVNYTVYQLPIEDDLVFWGIDFAEEVLGRKLSVREDLVRYVKVYEGKIESSEFVLDDIFRDLNINHPEDYKTRSLSVSDIVEIEDRYYFCDNSEWKELD